MQVIDSGIGKKVRVRVRIKAITIRIFFGRLQYRGKSAIACSYGPAIADYKEIAIVIGNPGKYQAMIWNNKL